MTVNSDGTDAARDGAPRKSRLDIEVEEILRKSDNVRQFPGPDRRRPRTSPVPRERFSRANHPMPEWARKARDTPLLVAVGFAIVAFLIADASPLLASLFALLAVAFVLLPIVQRYRRPSAAPETKMWRGRVIESRSPSGSLVESIKQWWRSRGPSS